MDLMKAETKAKKKNGLTETCPYRVFQKKKKVKNDLKSPLCVCVCVYIYIYIYTLADRVFYLQKTANNRGSR
jgi:hypothetical protein